MLQSHDDNDTIESLRAERNELRGLLAERERLLSRAEEDLRRAVAESYALYLTSLDITSQLDLQSTLSSILRRAILLTDSDNGEIYLLDAASNDLVISAEAHNNPAMLNLRFRSGEGMSGEVLLTGQPLVVDDYQTYPNRSPQLAGYSLHASVALPLRWQGKIIGVLSLHRTKLENTFSLDDLDSLQHVTVQAVIAINNAQLYAQEKARNNQLTTLYQASTRVTGSLDLEAVLRAAVESLITALNVSGCTLYEHHPSAGLSMLTNWVRSPQGRLEQGVHQNGGDGDSTLRIPHSLEHLLEAGLWLAFQVEDPLRQPELAAYMDQRGIRSMLLVPIALGQRAIGLIELSEFRSTRRFTMSDIDTAQALAAHIGVAIRHAQLHHQLQAQRVNEQAILLQLTRRLLEITETQKVADEAVKAVSEAFNSQIVALLLADNDGAFRPRAFVGWSPAVMARIAWKKGTGSGVGYAALTKEVVIVDDIYTETRFDVHAIMPEIGLRSVLLAPMLIQDEIVGVLTVSRTDPCAFTSDDAQLLSLMAYQSVVALERARLFESVQAYADLLEVRIDDRIRAIREEQERIEAILQATGEALIVLNPTGHIQRVNRAFETQHRCTAENVMGKAGVEVFGFDLIGKATFPEPVEGVWRGELQMTRSDGTTYDAAVTLSRVFDSAGLPLGVVASLRDISYLKELDRMKDRFVSSVSHELRTPLANIKLYQHLLMNGLETRRTQYFATLLRETERLQKLIEDLLLISRLDSDSVKPNMRLLNVNEVVQVLIEDRIALVSKQGFDLEYTLHPDPLFTVADENMLNQAVTNLLVNAMNYTPHGGKIQITTALETTDDRPEIIISIADTGMGMSPNDQARIFDRFFRGTAAQRTGAAGTGLGMAIVREIMDRHDGRVTFESEQERGSVFRLHLPIRSAIHAE